MEPLCELVMFLSDPGPKLQGQSDFGSMDMAAVTDVAGHLNMDSDDLVPSLQVRVMDCVHNG